MDKIYKIGNIEIDLSEINEIFEIEVEEESNTLRYAVECKIGEKYFHRQFTSLQSFIKGIKERDRLVSAWQEYKYENPPRHAAHANPHVTPQNPIYTFEIGTIDLSKITVIRGSRPKTDTKYLLEVFLKNGYSVAWRFKKKEDITRIKTQLTEAWKNYKNT